jgi:hypothetical protein
MKKNQALFGTISLVVLGCLPHIAGAAVLSLPLNRFATLSNPRSVCLTHAEHQREAIMAAQRWMDLMKKRGISVSIQNRESPNPRILIDTESESPKEQTLSNGLDKIFKLKGQPLSVTSSDKVVIRQQDFKVGDYVSVPVDTEKTLKLSYLSVHGKNLPIIAVFSRGKQANACSVGSIGKVLPPGQEFTYSINRKTYKIVIGER